MAGLGNPGQEYKDTRHNIGFKVIDFISRSLNVHLHYEHWLNSTVAEILLKTRKGILLCPQTYMNLSGQAIKACANHYKIDNRDILVIHDDLDLPLGKIKVTGKSGAGGHKGVLSTIDSLGDNIFPRIKIGIGRPEHGEQVEQFVLTPFDERQRNIVENTIRIAAAACELFIVDGLVLTMNKINCLNLINEEEKS